MFRALRDLGLDRDGPIAVEQVDASLTGTARPGGEIGSPSREIAPVWEMVEATISAGAVYSPSFFVLLAIAGLIGAVGILTSSEILIVGAMVVGPEYNAIIAAALGISERDLSAVRDGLLALVSGFSAAMVVTSLAFGSWREAHGSALQLVLNVVLLIAVGAAGLATQRTLWRRIEAHQRS